VRSPAFGRVLGQGSKYRLKEMILCNKLHK
jgi:hypothetical protein